MEKADPPGITEAQESLALFFVQILFRPQLGVHAELCCVRGPDNPVRALLDRHLQPRTPDRHVQVGLVEAEDLGIEHPLLVRQAVFLGLLARVEVADLALQPVETARRDLVDAGEITQIGDGGHQPTSRGALPIFLDMSDRAHPVDRIIDQHMRLQVWAIAFFHDVSPFVFWGMRFTLFGLCHAGPFGCRSLTMQLTLTAKTRRFFEECMLPCEERYRWPV